MKTTRKFMAILMVLAMILSMGAFSAFAADTGTITISNAQVGNTYTVYKVFDAVGNGTNISYKAMDSKADVDLPSCFDADGQGNITYVGEGTKGQLTNEDIAAIAAYVEGDEYVKTATAEDDTVTFENMPNGYYYITTTTGTLVTITSTNPDAIVEDKNEAPELDKVISGASSYDIDGKNALAQVGTDVKYTVTIQVKAGAVGYVFHDVMDERLSYNDDIAITVDGVTVDEANYDKTTAEGDTITVAFDDEWIATQAGNTITIVYTAKITAEALNNDPANNTATLDYGNSTNTDINTLPPEETSTYTAKYTVTKNDGNGKPLEGAGFVLKNTVGEYYKLANGVVTWVVSIDEATEYTSNENGEVPAFTGLANGIYTLVENTVPEGYNKAADVTFTIAEHDYNVNNLQQSTTVINNSGTTLPSTGGMGTVLLIGAGSVLAVAAALFLVTKKRVKNAEV